MAGMSVSMVQEVVYRYTVHDGEFPTELLVCDSTDGGDATITIELPHQQDQAHGGTLSLDIADSGVRQLAYLLCSDEGAGVLKLLAAAVSMGQRIGNVDDVSAGE